MATRWAAIFEDEPGSIAVRQKYAQAHFDYLAVNARRIRLAGGLRPELEGEWSGGLWIIDVTTREEAARLCEEDPFFVHGLRRHYRLFCWGRAPAYGELNSVTL